MSRHAATGGWTRRDAAPRNAAPARSSSGRAARAPLPPELAILQRLPDLVLRIDREGRILFANDAVRLLDGAPPDAYVGRLGRELSPTPELGERVAAARASVLATGRPTTFELEWPDASGHRWLEIRMLPEEVEEGVVQSVIAIGRDVTEAARARAEREAERAHLEEAQRIARVGSWRWDVAAGQIRVTGGWAEIFGTEDAMAAPLETLRRALVPEDRARFEARAREVDRDRLPFTEGTWRIRRPDGEERALHFRSRWTFDAAGARVYGTGTFQDVTEQAVAESEIARQRALLEHSQRLAHVGSWELDVATQRVTWSEEMYRIAGLPVGAGWMSRAAVAELFHPDDLALARTRIAEGVASGRDVEYEHRMLRPDGSTCTVVTHARMVTNEQGDVVRVVGATQDVTERRQLEAQYRQTQKMDSLGLLAGSVAHDFNNLLSAILGGVDLLREEVPAGSTAAADIADVRHAALRAAELTRQLLTFSRKQPHRPRVLDVRDAVRRAETLLRRLLSDAVALDVVLAERPSVVRADAAQLEQVLVNLVVNARDAIEAAADAEDRAREGGGYVVVEVGVRDLPRGLDAPSAGGPLPPGRYATLAVRDDGTGMSAETRARIFEPFFTTKPEGRGTGLGLSTVFGIVTQNGGAIVVHSTPGAGTTFEVLLPEVAEPVEDADAGAGAAPRGGTETVLLVEDERIVRETATRILERHGYRVIATRHGADALLAWESRRDDVAVVLTDLRMPTMGGRELVQRLRAERPALAVVLMSGYTSEQDEAEAEMVRRELFLEKPFTADTLLTHVRAALDRARPATA